MFPIDDVTWFWVIYSYLNFPYLSSYPSECLEKATVSLVTNSRSIIYLGMRMNNAVMFSMRDLQTIHREKNQEKPTKNQKTNPSKFYSEWAKKERIDINSCKPRRVRQIKGNQCSSNSLTGKSSSCMP